VLVVDDDRDVREAIAEILLSEGVMVVVARDGREALNHLTACPAKPALILLDLMMPRMNGWQLLEHLGGDPALASIPVCVVSASGCASPCGVREQLHKPFEIQALIDVVTRLLG
jgi:CheY-like chemotaxis protein